MLNDPDNTAPAAAEEPVAHASRASLTAICLVLIAITWIVFGPTVGHDFVNYDDHAYIHDQPEMVAPFSLHKLAWGFLNSYVSNWTPLTWISHVLDYELFGLKAHGHHFTNVFLHSISVVLLFFVFRQMTGTVWRSAFVAAVFAIHPLHVESVAWISERKDVLSGLFFMLTLGAYLRYTRQPSLGRYAAVSILFALGLMCKGMLVTLPCILLLLDYWPIQRIGDWRSLARVVLEKIPLLLIAVAAVAATTLAQQNALSSWENTPLWWRISNAFVSLVTYIGQTFWPTHLAAFYPHPLDRLPLWEVASAIALIVTISAAAVLVGRQHRYLLIGWFWFLGMLVPVLGLIQFGQQARADRYTYLPQIGLVVLVAWGVADLSRRWPYRSQLLGISSAIVLVALIWCARLQAGVWRDTETLWRHARAVTTRNHIADAALADIVMSRDQVGEAISLFRSALETYPDDFVAHDKLGQLLMRIGDSSEAIAHWKLALKIEPQDWNAESNLAWVYATASDPFVRNGRRAVELIEDVIQHSGTRNAILLRTLAAAYAESGRFSEAIRTAEEGSNIAIGEGNSELAADLRRNIDSYRMNIPWRDPLLEDAHPLWNEP